MSVCLSACQTQKQYSEQPFNKETIKNNGKWHQAGRRTTCTCSRGGVTQKLPRHILDLSFHTNAASLLSRAVNKEKGSSGNMKSQTREKLLHLRWFKKIIFQVLSRAIYGFSRIPPVQPRSMFCFCSFPSPDYSRIRIAMRMRRGIRSSLTSATEVTNCNNTKSKMT